MTGHWPWPLMVGYAIFKGVAVALVTIALGTLFWQSVIIACISGTLGLIGMVGAAIITTRATKENKKVLDQVHKKVDKIDNENC